MAIAVAGGVIVTRHIVGVVGAVPSDCTFEVALKAHPLMCGAVAACAIIISVIAIGAGLALGPYPAITACARTGAVRVPLDGVGVEVTVHLIGTILDTLRVLDVTCIAFVASCPTKARWADCAIGFGPRVTALTGTVSFDAAYLGRVVVAIHIRA